METINDYMMGDHRVCDAIFERADRAAEKGDFAELEREATDFLRRIAAHIEMEERLLFPAFEERTGMGAGGPTATMKDEHRSMEGLFEQMRDAIGARNAAAYRAASAQVMEILVPHNQKEEQMMYPMLDSALGDEAAALLGEVKAMAV
ncbi:MAG: hemerythrin domain-containing protein [Burkholderiaceae bacterium]|nr:hemerythrin domain-containing protein [Burkholderiaceae bacterium]